MVSIEFISYDGKYPILCSGSLILKINGESVKMPKYCMKSGGTTWIDKDNIVDHVIKGKWRVNVPYEYKEYKEEIEDCVNRNVEWGCCGGCL